MFQNKIFLFQIFTLPYFQLLHICNLQSVNETLTRTLNFFSTLFIELDAEDQRASKTKVQETPKIILTISNLSYSPQCSFPRTKMVKHT